MNKSHYTVQAYREENAVRVIKCITFLILDSSACLYIVCFIEFGLLKTLSLHIKPG